MTGLGSVSAPENAARKHERSARASERSRVSASYNVGTPTMRVGLPVRMTSATAAALKTGTRIALPPLSNTALMHKPSPTPWKMGRAASITSPGPSPTHAAACIPSAVRLRFDSITPLGEPVVPPEKRIAARSSAVPWGCGAAGQASAISGRHQRTVRSRGMVGAVRPRVSRYANRLRGPSVSVMRVTMSCSSPVFARTAANLG